MVSSLLLKPSNNNRRRTNATSFRASATIIITNSTSTNIMKALVCFCLLASVFGNADGSLAPPTKKVYPPSSTTTTAPATTSSNNNNIHTTNDNHHDDNTHPPRYGAHTPQLVPLEKKESRESSLAYRRPMVDAGLRYNSNDWFINFILIPKSFILKRISNHLMANAFGTLLTICIHEYYPHFQIPMTGHSLLASSLGLLLSYRTDSAYSRFWEARSHWTNTKATCRNLAITMKTHLEPVAPLATAKFLHQLAAYPHCLMHLCLGGAAKLPDSALQHLQDYTHLFVDFKHQPAWPAMLLCFQLQQTLRDAELESPTVREGLVESAYHTALCQQLEILLDQMSNCEKILRTPVPWTYGRHTSRFLTLWIGTLPLALIGTVSKWLVLPIVLAAGYCMLGIEEIGHLIEQPFVGDPLDGDDRIFVELDDDGEASEIITRGRKTMPYDIGIPVCSLAQQIKAEVQQIANMPLHRQK